MRYVLIFLKRLVAEIERLSSRERSATTPISDKPSEKKSSPRRLRGVGSDNSFSPTIALIFFGVVAAMLYALYTYLFIPVFASPAVSVNYPTRAPVVRSVSTPLAPERVPTKLAKPRIVTDLLPMLRLESCQALLLKWALRHSPRGVARRARGAWALSNFEEKSKPICCLALGVLVGSRSAYRF